MSGAPSDKGETAVAPRPERPVLSFETAGSACSVVVALGRRIVAEERRPLRHGHAEALVPMIGAAMRRAGVAARDLAAIATTVGPGGFTGLRAGLATARGIALATGASLIGVTGFEAVVAALAECETASETRRGLLIALDSRRDDFYVQCFDRGRKPLGPPQAVEPAALPALAARFAAEQFAVAGDAAEPAAAALAGMRFAVVPASAPDARGVLAAGLARLDLQAPLEPARPLYLRPPDVTFPSGGRAARNAIS